MVGALLTVVLSGVTTLVVLYYRSCLQSAITPFCLGSAKKGRPQGNAQFQTL